MGYYYYTRREALSSVESHDNLTVITVGHRMHGEFHQTISNRRRSVIVSYARLTCKHLFLIFKALCTLRPFGKCSVV